MLKLIFFIVIVLLLICGCFLFTKNVDKKYENEQEEHTPTTNQQPQTPQSSVGGGAHREATSETLEAKNDTKPRDSRGRFVKK